MSDIVYTPAGPTVQAFHDSQAFVRGIMGPIGSSKSTGCIMEIVQMALRQAPGPDGISRFRAVAIRNTYPQLKSTTIKSWTQWFPEDLFGKLRWDSPIRHEFYLTPKHWIEVWFLALDQPKDIQNLLSLETTLVWLNEARELPKAVLDGASGRVGRYPIYGATRTGVIMDTNPPADDHWWYRLAEEEKPDGFEFFRQPGGLDPGAENLNYLNQTPESFQLPLGHPTRIGLGREYYRRLLAGKSPDWVKVYVHGLWGSVSDGRPVHPEYNDRTHVAEIPLQPHKGIPLTIGFDFGLTPACVIGQLSPRGQLRILDEVVGENMGLQQFLDSMLLPLLSHKYAGMDYVSPHDPAGTQRSQADEVTCHQILRRSGLKPASAFTNGFQTRRESVAWFMNRLVDGEPALLISPQCKALRRGLNGDYMYERVQVSGEERFKDAPKKNMSSHVCEALQYLCLRFYQNTLRDRDDKAGARRKIGRRHATFTPISSAGY